MSSGQHPAQDQRSRTALYASVAAGLVAALVAALVATVSPASAEQAPEPDALVHARGELAYCQRLRTLSTAGSARRTRANTCIADAQAVIDSYTPSPSPSPTSTPSPTPTASPTTAPPTTAPPTTAPPTTAPPSPSPSPSPGPTAPTGCALPLYPTPACTGVGAGWTPTTTINGNYTATQNGQLIDGWLITGELLIRAQNVVVRNSEIRERIYNQVSGIAYNGLVIVDSRIGPTDCISDETNGLVGVGGYTLRRSHLCGVEGPRVGGYGYSGNRLGPVLIEDNYIKIRNRGSQCDHSDGIQGYDEPPGTVIRHNTIDMSNVSCSTGAIYVGHPMGATVVDNLLLGGSYVMRLHQSGSQTSYPRVVGNRIVDGAWDYGPVLVDACSTIGEWRDNTVVRIDSGYAVTSTVRQLTTCPEATGVGSLP